MKRRPTINRVAGWYLATTTLVCSAWSAFAVARYCYECRVADEVNSLVPDSAGWWQRFERDQLVTGRPS